MSYQFIPQKPKWTDIVFPWLKVGRTINMGVKAVRSYMAGDSQQGWEYTKAAGEAYLHSIPGMVVVGSVAGSKTLGTILAGFATSFVKMTPTVAKVYTVLGKTFSTAFRTIGKVWVWPAKKSIQLVGRTLGRSVATMWKAALIRSPSLAKLVSGVTGIWKTAASIGVKVVSAIKSSAVFIGKTVAAASVKAYTAVSTGVAALGTKIATAASGIASAVASVPVVGWIIAGAVVIAAATIGTAVVVGLKYKDNPLPSTDRDAKHWKTRAMSQQSKFALEGGN